MSVSFDVQKHKDLTPSAQYDAVVMGAGPYGLAISAHLSGRGLKVATFGKPIYFWRNHMPQGMLLRSYWWATSLSDPQGCSSFQQYFHEKGLKASEPLPIETFIDYGLWFQQRAVPDVDETYISTIKRVDGTYKITLDDGRTVQSNSVVMAPGLHYYLHIPEAFAHLPSSLASHTADHYDLSTYKGQHVVIVGGGQAALETAALLNESGATVDVISRRSIRWLQGGNSSLPPLLKALRAPKAGIGNGWLNFLLEKYPYVYQGLPRDTKDYLLATRNGPAGSSWLRPRIHNKVNVHEQVNIEKIEEMQGSVRLTLSSGKVLDADHIMLGTGYRADIKRLPMLDTALVDSIQTYVGSPVLNPYFESNVHGLYFVGFSAARSFGPFYRFVVGNEAAARRVTEAISRQVAHVR